MLAALSDTFYRKFDMPPRALEGRVIVPRTKTGADVPKAPVIVITPDDVRKYMAAVDESFVSLRADMKEKIVWADPDAVEVAAKVMGGVDPTMAAQYEADAKALRKRAEGRDPAQVKREEAWGARFIDFQTRWSTFKDYVKYPAMAGTWVTGQWPTVKKFHEELNRLQDDFAALGYTPSSPKKEPPGPVGVPDVSTAVKIAVPTIALIVVGGAVAYMVLRG